MSQNVPGKCLLLYGLFGFSGGSPGSWMVSPGLSGGPQVVYGLSSTGWLVAHRCVQLVIIHINLALKATLVIFSLDRV